MKAIKPGLLLAAFYLSLLFVSCKKENGNNPGQADNIERVSLLLDYEAGYGGYIYPVHNPYVFFKNGVVVKEPFIPVSELSSELLTKDIARNWGTWEENGSKVAITWKDGDRSEKDWPGASGIAAGRDERLQGTFSSFAGGGNLSVGGTVGVISYSNMSFTTDGWFVNKKVAGGTGSGNTAYTESNTAGQYTIDGYGITLEFNSGDVKRYFFCFYGGDKTVFRIAGRTYTD